MTEEDLKEPKYIEVVYDDLTQDHLLSYCNQHNFDCSVTHSGRNVSPEDFNFHSTVWFTTTSHVIKNCSKSIEPFRVTPIGFDLFGPDKNMLVLLIKGGDYVDRPLLDPDYDALLNLRNGFGNTYGMKDIWPDYKPHITLSYVYTGDIPNVPLPDFDMVADVMNIKTQQKKTS